MLGIGLDDIKEWNRHWGHGGHTFKKEVLFPLYQSAVSHERKQFKLTLKKRILAYCCLCKSELRRVLIINADVIIALWEYVYSVNICVQAIKLKRGQYISASLLFGSASNYFYRICSWTEDLCNRCVMCFAKNKKEGQNNSRNVYISWIPLLLWLIKAAQVDHKFDITMNQNGESDLIFNE